MKYLSSSRLGCHVTSRVVNHLVVLLLLLIAINKFCFADFVVYPHVVTLGIPLTLMKQTITPSCYQNNTLFYSVEVWLLWKHEVLSTIIYYQIVYTEKVSKVSSFLIQVSVGGFQLPGVNVAKLSFSCTLS